MKLRDKIIWLIAIVLLVVFIVNKYKKETYVEDISHLKTASISQLEKELGVSLISSSEKMEKKVFEYSKSGNVWVRADEEKKIAAIYIDGQYRGFCMANPEYSMFGVELGKVRWGLDDKLSYSYERTFEIDEDIDRSFESGRSDFPIFYCNWTQGDCVVVLCNKATGNVTAITYYNDVSVVTERLKF